MAIKVVKPGVLPVPKDEEFAGKCRKCGCEVRAAREDVKDGYSRVDPQYGYYVMCPTDGCGRQIDMEKVIYRSTC